MLDFAFPFNMRIRVAVQDGKMFCMNLNALLT